MRGLRRPRRVLGRLLGFLLLAGLPVLGLAALGLDTHWRAALREAEVQLGRERDGAVALNRAALKAADALLGTLAVAIEAAPAACAALLEPVRQAGLDAVLLGGDGGAACGPAVSPAAASPPAGPRDGQRSVRVGVALPDGRAMLVADVPLAPPSPGARLWLIEAESGLAGQPDWLFRPADGGAAVRVPGPDGQGWLAAAGRIGPGLGIVLARPEAPMRRAALLVALRRLGEVAAMLALGGLAVVLGTRRAVTRPLARLRAAVARWRAGAPLELHDADGLPEELRELAEAFREGADAIALRDAALEEAVARAELLAEEVHHRVKNNLQIVSSLLALQAGRVADPAARAEFEATRDRVAAIATLHRHMYMHHDPEAIDLRAFLQELGEQLFATVGERPGRRIGLRVEASPLRIASDQAVPLALLITEAVSVALKHGFPAGRRGLVAIRVAAEGRQAHLSVEDDGEWPRAEDRLRSSLMRGFARQLGGELVVERGRVALVLPLRAPLPRERARLRVR